MIHDRRERRPMQIRWLEAFAYVARHGQINEAAAELHMSQSTLSRQLASLEKHVGAQLLVREPRGVRLTPAGQIVLSRSSHLLNQMRELNEVLHAERLHPAMARIGVPPGVPTDWLRQRLKLLEGFQLILNEGTTNEQLDLLDKGQLDLAITRERSSTHPSSLILSQPLGVAMPPHSRLRQKVTPEGELPVASLDGSRLLAYAQSALRSSEGALRSLAEGAGAEIEWIFRRFGLHGDLIAEFSQAEGAMTVASSQVLHSSDWVWHPLVGNGPLSEDLTIRTWANWRADAPPHIERCLDVLHSEKSAPRSERRPRTPEAQRWRSKSNRSSISSTLSP